MTTLPPSIHAYLAGYVERHRHIALLRAAGMAAAFGLTWMLMWCIVDRMVPLAGWVRLLLLLIGLAGMGMVLLRPLRAVLSRRIDWVAAAAQIEAHHPAFAERLQTVTSRLAGPQAYRGSPQLVEHLVHQVESEVDQDDPRRLVNRWRAIRPWIGAGIVGLIVGGLMFVAWLDLPRLVARFAAPLASISPATTTRIHVEHSPEQVIQGRPLVIHATAENLDDRGLRLHLGTDGRHFSTRPMAATGDGFTYTLNAIDRDLYYRVSGGDAVTPVQTVRVLRRPTVLEYRIRYEYPAYINRQPLTITSPDGTIEAPVDTRATLTIVSSEPLGDATLIVGDGVVPTQPSVEAHIRHATIPITTDGTYRLMLVSQRGAQGQSAGPMDIRAIPDRPPIVRLIEPAGDLRLTPRDVLAVRYQAFDDYGIDALRLVANVNGDDRLNAPLRLRGDPARQEAIADLDLARLEVTFGDLVRLRIEAEDGRGHTATSESRSILVSPRSIDMNTHQRIAELRDAQLRAQMLLDALRAAATAFDQHPVESDPMRDLWLPPAEYDRALTTATEQAMLIRQGLLRVITRSPSAGRSTLLAGLADAAQHITSTSDALMLNTSSMETAAVKAALQQATERTTSLQRMLTELSEGEQAEALLAEQANLAALGGNDAEALSDAARENRRRARGDFETSIKALKLDPNARDLERRLQEKVDRLAKQESEASHIDYAEAAQQWAAGPTEPLVRSVFALRLEAAAQAEAVRPDTDLVRAHDLHLASRAATALTAGSAAGDDSTLADVRRYPAALADLQAAHTLQQRDQDVRPPDQWAAIHAAADAAREQMRRWAGTPSTDNAPVLVRAGNDDALAVMEANLAMAQRDYDRAASIDQQLASMGSAASGNADAPTDDAAQDSANASDDASSADASHGSADASNGASSDQDRAAMARGRAPGTIDAADMRLAQREPVERAMEQARRIDEIVAEQSAVADRTRQRSSALAAELQAQQAQVAEAIDAVRREASGFADAATADSAGNTREQALAALKAAREQLAAMPQALAAVQQEAEHHQQAADAVQQATQDHQAAPDDQQASTDRRVMAAELVMNEARHRLDIAAQGVHPDMSQAIADQLRPYVPETDGTITAIEQKLTVALRQLQQAVEAPDHSAIERSVVAAREAIRDVHIELRAAQEALSAQDPLVAARWFARQAAADLAMRPPDFDSAERNQQAVVEALDQAWRNSVHDAARGRLAGSRAFGSLYAFDLPIAIDGAAMIESDIPLPAALGRAWGWLRAADPAPITTTGGDADPPGYQEALRAYFEALGSTPAKESK